MKTYTLHDLLTESRAVVNLWPEAGQLVGLSRSTTFDAARGGHFPCRVLTLGRLKKVAVADLLRALGFDPNALAQSETPARLAAESGVPTASPTQENDDVRPE